MANHQDLFIWFDDGDEAAAAKSLNRLKADWPDLVETANALHASTGSAVGALTALVAQGAASRLVEESAGWEGWDFEAEERLGRKLTEREAADASTISSAEKAPRSD